MRQSTIYPERFCSVNAKIEKNPHTSPTTRTNRSAAGSS
jgi:hypothetical protein